MFFFCKQKTAYEMRISDWSSDVCSSDLAILTAIEIVENHLDEFTRKHYDKLEKALGIDSNTLKEAVGEILKLNPKPGDSAMGNSDKQMQVIPDFRIANKDGELVQLGRATCRESV